MTKRYATLNGIKRAAIKLKRRMGMSHSHALEQIAREAGHPDYFSARQAYTGHPAPFRDEEWLGDEAFEPATEEPPVEIIEMSPELSALLKRQRDLDIADAGPQAPELAGDYRGVDLSSRWEIKHELLTMRHMVDDMPDMVRARVQSIWCDSNAQAYYSVTIAPGRWQEAIEFDVLDAVRAATDGFNGLTVEGDGNYKQFNPEWDGDDYDYG